MKPVIEWAIGLICQSGFILSPPTPLSSTDSVNVNETVVQPVSHNILSFSISLPSDAGAFYRNPFRELDVSSLPLEFQRRLTEFPFLTQIAILKNSELQKRFFPEYCSYRVGDDRGSVWRDSCDSLRNWVLWRVFIHLSFSLSLSFIILAITPLSFPFCFSCILVCIYPILMKPLLFVPIIRGANWYLYGFPHNRINPLVNVSGCT